MSDETNYSPRDVPLRDPSNDKTGTLVAFPRCPEDRQFPLKDGAEVFRVAAAARGSDMDMNPQFIFEVAFGEGEVVKGKPLIETLHELAQFVESFITLFPPLFSQAGTP